MALALLEHYLRTPRSAFGLDEHHVHLIALLEDNNIVNSKGVSGWPRVNPRLHAETNILTPRMGFICMGLAMP